MSLFKTLFNQDESAFLSDLDVRYPQRADVIGAAVADPLIRYKLALAFNGRRVDRVHYDTVMDGRTKGSNRQYAEIKDIIEALAEYKDGIFKDGNPNADGILVRNGQPVPATDADIKSANIQFSPDYMAKLRAGAKLPPLTPQQLQADVAQDGPAPDVPKTDFGTVMADPKKLDAIIANAKKNPDDLAKLKKGVATFLNGKSLEQLADEVFKSPVGMAEVNKRIEQQTKREVEAWKKEHPIQWGALKMGMESPFAAVRETAQEAFEKGKREAVEAKHPQIAAGHPELDPEVRAKVKAQIAGMFNKYNKIVFGTDERGTLSKGTISYQPFLTNLAKTEAAALAKQKESQQAAPPALPELSGWDKIKADTVSGLRTAGDGIAMAWNASTGWLKRMAGRDTAIAQTSPPPAEQKIIPEPPKPAQQTAPAVSTEEAARIRSQISAHQKRIAPLLAAAKQDETQTIAENINAEIRKRTFTFGTTAESPGMGKSMLIDGTVKGFINGSHKTAGGLTEANERTDDLTPIRKLQVIVDKDGKRYPLTNEAAFRAAMADDTQYQKIIRGKVDTSAYVAALQKPITDLQAKLASADTTKTAVADNASVGVPNNPPRTAAAAAQPRQEVAQTSPRAETASKPGLPPRSLAVTQMAQEAVERRKQAAQKSHDETRRQFKGQVDAVNTSSGKPRSPQINRDMENHLTQGAAPLPYKRKPEAAPTIVQN